VHICGKGFSGEDIADKVIGITRIHLEEDVGKLNHFAGYSGIDFNRAGVPLMEIVSEPDMTAAMKPMPTLPALKQIMQYADISDCDMEKGQMRWRCEHIIEASRGKAVWNQDRDQESQQLPFGASFDRA